MKMEKIGLEKFQQFKLKKEQMFTLNAGGTKTAGGTNLCHQSQGKWYLVDYAYDVTRDGIDGGLSFHGYTNWRPQNQC